MTRPKLDDELRAISACVDALLKLDEAQQGRAMAYLGDRFLLPPEALPIRLECRQPDEERAAWPAELGCLGEEPQPANVGDQKPESQ